jgi:hypothetical protein
MNKEQFDFFNSKSEYGYGRAEHGGCDKQGRDRRQGKRKVQRPFDRKKALLLTLKSSRAVGKFSMRVPRHRLQIEKLIHAEVAKAHAKLHSYANVGNHLHLVATFPSRAAFQKFLRTITSLIARMVTGARKGRPFGKFWDALAHTRVITGLKATQDVLWYVSANFIEAALGKKARAEVLRGKIPIGLFHLPDY